MIHTMSEEQYLSLCEESGGFCNNCGEEIYGVEPDARNYHCDGCGENQVFGVEELLIMGDIEIE